MFTTDVPHENAIWVQHYLLAVGAVGGIVGILPIILYGRQAGEGTNCVRLLACECTCHSCLLLSENART
jgi:hypothetical protein